MLAQIFNDLFGTLSSIPLSTLLIIVWGSFGALFLAALIACFLSPKIKSVSKRPYLSLVNAYAALTLAAYLTSEQLAPSALAAALFWFVGYLSYGVLCLFTKEKQPTPSPVAISSMPVRVNGNAEVMRTDTPAAKSNVRLEHAIFVTETLLQKNLGRSDRQELEKLKGTLDILQMKGTLTPAEADILNDRFNALLKLMAKYNM